MSNNRSSNAFWYPFAETGTDYAVNADAQDAGNNVDVIGFSVLDNAMHILDNFIDGEGVIDLSALFSSAASYSLNLSDEAAVKVGMVPGARYQKIVVLAVQDGADTHITFEGIEIISRFLGDRHVSSFEKPGYMEIVLQNFDIQNLDLSDFNLQVTGSVEDTIEPEPQTFAFDVLDGAVYVLEGFIDGQDVIDLHGLFSDSAGYSMIVGDMGAMKLGMVPGATYSNMDITAEQVGDDVHISFDGLVAEGGMKYGALQRLIGPVDVKAETADAEDSMTLLLEDFDIANLDMSDFIL